MPAAPSLTTRYGYVPSPLGDILLTGGDQGLTGLYLLHRVQPSPTWVRDDAPFEPVRAQLDEYFAGRRTHFDVAMRLEGSPFQRQVWSALQAIPYGETTSYGEIARRIGRPTASRAVGAANGRNPISVIIPCHRVIGADNSLTGYGWGIERKAWLLAHERRER
jgi:methylated-DNA-[protein]-cysteine S-methyltransferase